MEVGMKRAHSSSGSENEEYYDSMAISLIEHTKTYISECLSSDDSSDLLIAPSMLDCASDLMKLSKTKRSFWKKSWRNREKGSYCFLTKEMKCFDPNSFQNYLRMPSDTFELLLSLIEDKIKKQTTIMREAIPPNEKLAATLRYLATGETFQSTNFQTRLSTSFLSKAVPEVCNAIWDCLKDKYLHFPDSVEEWEAIADEFSIRWQFPHCLGALDGKHISFRSAKKDGAYYHNYKDTNSIVLLALVDVQYRLIYVDIGCNGRENDAGVLLQSTLKKVIDDGSKHFPPDKNLASRGKLPFVIIADDAFPLQKHILKPYPYTTSDIKKRIFNARLSRPRQCVEHAFGMLVNRFRALLNTMNVTVETVQSITQACCVLHNFLLAHNVSVDGKDQAKIGSNIQSGTLSRRCGSERNAAASNRERFAEYFANEGKLDSQIEQLTSKLT